MKKLLLLFVSACGIMFYSCQKNDIPQIDDQVSDLVKITTKVIEGKYIVQFEETGLLKSASKDGKIAPEVVLQSAREIFSLSNMPIREPDFVYSNTIKGMAVAMTESEAIKLAAAPGVKSVNPDLMITLELPHAYAKPTPPTPTPPAQTVPWGIARVGGGGANLSNTSNSPKAWIIDTGIDLDHTDLNTSAMSLGKTFVTRTTTPDDDNGHGTHCAGIVGAVYNTIGVVGVAPNALLVPIKVLDKRGSGTLSGVIKGVDYVAANANAGAGDVANMSLGGGISTDLDDAVYKMAVAGIKVSLAAGNESDNANNHSPARVNHANIWTVSAMASGDLWASFSNYGNPPVDNCAPGVSILSTVKGGTYATYSGTSMAAPHVCGLLLLNRITAGKLNSDGFVVNDPDPIDDPIAHY